MLKRLKWKRTGHGSYRKVADGVWQVRYRPFGTKGPQRNRKIAGSEIEVRQLLESSSANRSRLTSGLPARFNWKECLDLYSDRLKTKGVTEAHALRVRTALDAFREGCGLANPADVQPVHVETWINKLRAKGTNAPTANKLRGFLFGFFRRMVRLKLLPTNPVDAIDKLPEAEQPKRNITPAEYARVWKLCSPRLRDLLDFLLLTGCRISEAAAMRFEDVDNEGTWTIPKRKSGYPLRIVLPPDALRAVKRQPKRADGLVWHRWDGRTGDVKGHGFHPGAPLERTWARNAIASRCKAAKVRAFSPHDLRHALAVWARERGLSAFHIRDALGHTTVAMSEHYAGRGVSKVVHAEIAKVRRKAIQSIDR